MISSPIPHFLAEYVEWLDRAHDRCHIYWRRPEEWATLVYDWAVANGLLNTVCSLYELTQGDDVHDECRTTYRNG